MKNNRNGQASTLSETQLNELLETLAPRYRLLFGICYFTSCRVSEALSLKRTDIVGDRIVFRASTTKEKKTRELKISTRLASVIQEVGLPDSGYVFPNGKGGHISRQAADKALREACDYIGLLGVSTHSFRRSSITCLHSQGVPLKTIQRRSGHASLANLALYIDVDQAEIDAAGELL
jgi:integrase/recombinase XerD